jgi:hypothetical protein
MGGRAFLLMTAIAAQAVCGFLPWLRSGQRQRNGFELIDAARTLDALDSTTQRALALGMYLVPLAATLCCLAVLLDRRRTAAAIALVTGLLGLVAALSIEWAPLPSLIGVHATLLAAVVVFGGGLAELLKGVHHERAPQPI